MKTSELTLETVRAAILPANMSNDQQLTIKWLVLPEHLRPNRCRAADRIAPYISPNGPKRTEPLAIPGATPVPTVAPEAEVAPVVAPVEPAPVSSPTVATIDIKADGAVTVRPSSPPPAPIEAPMDLQLKSQEPDPDPVKAAEVDLTPEAALRAIRGIYSAWKGGQHVCGNAFRRMHEVESMIKRAGF